MNKHKTPETRERMSKAKKGKKFSDEHRQAIANGHKGKSRTPETRERISEGKKKYIFTAEHLEHLREANQKQSIRICKRCGKEYMGTKSSIYCPECRR